MALDDSPGPIRMIVADDHLMFRRGVCAVLETFNNQVQVVCETSTADETVHMAQHYHPDVVLLDLQMPRQFGRAARPDWQNGVDAIMLLKRSPPAPKVLVLSYLEEPKVLFAALRAGAHGYITKGDSYDGAALADAIQRTFAGEAIYGPLVAQVIRDYHMQRNRDQQPADEQLTARERDVLDLLAERKSNQDIARELVISIKTVKTHVASILGKLHLSSRHEVPMYIRLRGEEPT